MSFSVMLLVLLGASLHATWNTLVKGGKDKYLDTVGVLLGATLLTLLYLPFLPLPARASWPYLAYVTLIALSYEITPVKLIFMQFMISV
ncbi:MAG: EamA family transporter [Chthonomonadales bacterium]|nr:EamA family transporter [Chthonomonadales bacterium]